MNRYMHLRKTSGSAVVKKTQRECLCDIPCMTGLVREIALRGTLPNDFWLDDPDQSPSTLSNTRSVNASGAFSMNPVRPINSAISMIPLVCVL